VKKTTMRKFNNFEFLPVLIAGFFGDICSFAPY